MAPLQSTLSTHQATDTAQAKTPHSPRAAGCLPVASVNHPLDQMIPTFLSKPSRWRHQPSAEATNPGSSGCYTSNLEITNLTWEIGDQVLRVPLKSKDLMIDSHQVYVYVSQIHKLLCFCKSSQDNYYAVSLPFTWDC